MDKEDKDPENPGWLKSLLGKLKRNLHLAVIISFTSLCATVGIGVWHNYKRDFWMENSLQVQADREERKRLVEAFESARQRGQNFERRRNFEEAAKAYQQAQKAVTRETMPEQWAQLQQLQGRAMIQHAATVKSAPLRAKLLDDATAALDEALAVYTRGAFPDGWANVQQWLGVSRVVRAVSDNESPREALLAEAVRSFEQALEVYADYSRDWADTQFWMGRARAAQAEAATDPATGEALFEQASQAFRQAGEVHTDRTPDWANVQAWTARVWIMQAYAGNREDGASRLSRAERVLTRTLEVYTREEFPRDWANVHYWLGRAYVQQATATLDFSKRRHLLDQAEQAFRKALEIHTRRDWPENWTVTQNDLNIVLRQRAIIDANEPPDDGKDGRAQASANLTAEAWAQSKGVTVREAAHKKDVTGRTLVHLAASEGRVDVLEWLRAQGANLHATDNLDETPVFLAASNGRIGAMSWLAEQGAEINLKDRNGWTPMFTATMFGHIEAMAWLKERGLDVSARDHGGQTPMFFAARTGRVEVMAWLTSQGAEVNVKANDGRTPLSIAGSDEAKKWLRDHGAQE